ncbi:hypothetical protein BKA56DRAFT_650373 [Ilyonectria sp. MPI-CAGE-AT-0026]|nr:hypothetical protein BKA56DRAFT_650373 [Ilyonectria sp. MPI-CAGE-AT-0026]
MDGVTDAVIAGVIAGVNAEVTVGVANRVPAYIFSSLAKRWLLALFPSRLRFIKLKKDYIPGLGDTADFAIIGGRRNARDEYKLGIGSLWWTSFYIGCIKNKDDICRFNTKPRFCIINTVNRYSISKENITYLNCYGYFTRAPFAKSMPEFDILFEPAQRLQPVELFKHPFIIEVVGAGFDKPANVRYFALRFPRVLKVHKDRSFRDIISFGELQEIAQRYLEVPDGGEQEEKSWLRRLRGYEHLLDRSRTSSPSDDAVSVADICEGRQSNRQQEKLGTAVESQCLDNISSGASKRKIAPEVPEERATSRHPGPLASRLKSTPHADPADVLSAPSLTLDDEEATMVWDATTGACLRTLKVHDSSVQSDVFSTDGQDLLPAIDNQSAEAALRGVGYSGAFAQAPTDSQTSLYAKVPSIFQNWFN